MIVVSLVELSSFNVAFAGDFVGCGESATNIHSTIDDDTLSVVSLACVLARVANIMILSVGAIFVIMIAYGGIKYSTALGDPKHLQSASQTWFYAIVGLFIVLAAYLIIDIVLGWFGVDVNLDISDAVGDGICKFLDSACIRDPACGATLPGECT